MDIKKGDLVRLLVPHHDGVQRHEADATVKWWSDTPPTADQAVLVEAIEPAEQPQAATLEPRTGDETEGTADQTSAESKVDETF